MSRKILIVGGGQSALYLGCGLLAHGYEVTLATGQRISEIMSSPPSILQFTTPAVLAQERASGLPVWEDAPPIRRLGMRVRLGEADLAFTGSFTGGHTLSVDRRIKMAAWLDHFEKTGGKVVIHGLTVSDLEYFTQMYDLVVVAVGSGELGGLFDSDPTRQGGAHPRTIVQAYFDGDTVEVPPEREDVVEVVSTQPDPDSGAGAGEVFFAPVLTRDERAGYAVMALAPPGGALDAAVPPRTRAAATRHPFSAGQALHTLMDQTAVWAPDIAQYLAGARPLGDAAVLGRRVEPVVRDPVGVLPSGRRVLGMADAVVTTGPLCGQGWNNSTRCAQIYLDHILDRGDRPFDAGFMEAAFADFWDTVGAASAQFSAISHGHFPDHLPHLLAAAATRPEVADRWVQGIDDPRRLAAWMFDPAEAQAYLDHLPTPAR